MKSWKYCLLTLSLLALPSLAHAQQIKIGLVDFQRAINEVNEGKTAKAALKSQFDAKQKALEGKQAELTNLKNQLEAQGAAMSPDGRKQQEAQYRDKFLELQKLLGQYRNEMATKEAELTQNIVKRMRNVVNSIGSKDGYTLIFESSQDAVLFAPGAKDLTMDVIAAFNSGAGAGK